MNRPWNRKSIFWPVILSLLIVFFSLRMIYEYVVARDEKTIHLTIESSGDSVTARIDDEDPVTIDVHDRDQGSKIGLYIYHSYEDSDALKRTYFSNISIRGPLLGERKYARIGGGSDTAFIGNSEGWFFDTDRGVYHNRIAGERAACIMQGTERKEFTLEVDITNPVDAGVLFRATDEDNCHMFVARSIFNDAFFTSLHKGRPGPIMQLRPFKTLRTRTEALRLAGLTSDLVMRACILLLLLWIVNHFVRVSHMGWVPLVEKSLAAWINSPWLLAYLFVLTLFMTATVAFYSLDAVPHIADATAYLFQAKVFAAGKLYAVTPALPEFFDVEHILVEGDKWFGKYPPLFPALLAVGVKFGVPWLVNPVLGALTACLVFMIARDISHSNECGFIAWVLLVLSPFFLFISGCMMAHAATFFFFALAVYLALLGLNKNSIRLVMLAGASIGAMILVRPFTAFLQFWPLALYIVIIAKRDNGFKKSIITLISFGSGVLPFALLYIAWNKLYISNNQQDIGAYAAYFKNDVLGFGPDKGYGWLMTWGDWGHTPAKALRSVHNYLYYTCNYLFGWPLRMSMAFVGIPLIFGRKKGVSLYLAGSFLVLVIGHMFYWATQHVAYGARYWYTGILAGVILTAIGMRLFVELLSMGRNEKSQARVIMAVLVVAAVIWNSFYYMPERIREGHNYGNISASLKRCVESLDLSKGLVFLKTEDLKYNDGFFMNDPFMQSELIFARDLGDQKNQKLIEQYPEYPVYKWNKKILKLER